MKKAGKSQIDERRLKKLWFDILHCRNCSKTCSVPSFRPPGKNFHTGGVVFVQINPGQIGSLSSAAIRTRYKSRRYQTIALEKARTQKKLIKCQQQFCTEPDQKHWKAMCEEYRHAMSTAWGWPPGKYARTVEEHGFNIDDVAIINLAQCPVKNDRYSNELLLACWDKWGHKLLELYKPSLMIAQSTKVFRLLSKGELPDDVALVQGYHHASRISNLAKVEIQKKVLAAHRS